MAISPQRLTIYLYSAHRAVIFAIAQLSCFGDIDTAIVDMTLNHFYTKVKVVHLGTNRFLIYEFQALPIGCQ